VIIQFSSLFTPLREHDLTSDKHSLGLSISLLPTYDLSMDTKARVQSGSLSCEARKTVFAMLYIWTELCETTQYMGHGCSRVGSSLGNTLVICILVITGVRQWPYRNHKFKKKIKRMANAHKNIYFCKSRWWNICFIF